jgi:hypothetical protein
MYTVVFSLLLQNRSGERFLCQSLNVEWEFHIPTGKNLVDGKNAMLTLLIARRRPMHALFFC